MVDVTTEYSQAPLLEPIDAILMPWGDAVGEVDYSAVFGPCCFDVMADGSIALIDSYNLRVQRYDATNATWSVIYRFDREEPARPDGIAAFGEGLLALTTFPVGSSLSSRTVLMLDSEGTTLGESRIPINFPSHLEGETDVWAGLDWPPEHWVRVTADQHFERYDGELLDALPELIDSRVREGFSPLPIKDLEMAGVITDTLADERLEFQVARVERWIGDPHPDWLVTSTARVASTSWFIDESTDVAAAAQYLADEAVIAIRWITNPPQVGIEYLFGFLWLDGGTSFVRVPYEQWMETGTFDYFQVHGDRLYLLQTYPDGARIEIYEIPAG